jgi:phospholipase/carboxylesterase
MPLLPAIELATGHHPIGSVIWMHGLGADGNDFVPIVKELGLAEKLALRFIFPNAPMRPITINNGYVMRGWYDILSLDALERHVDEAGIRESQAAIEALIAREVERGIKPEKIVLAGFSQGGVIALQTGLRHKERLGGIMALSTYLSLAESLPQEASAANKDIPIFLAHGTHDDIIAIHLAHASRDALTRAGYQVEWHDYRMPHSVCPEEIADIGTWLRGIYADGR